MPANPVEVVPNASAGTVYCAASDPYLAPVRKPSRPQTYMLGVRLHNTPSRSEDGVEKRGGSQARAWV